MRDQFKRFSRRSTVGVTAAMIALLALGGCASSKKALEKQVQELEREVLRLRAERSNLAARNRALDDERLLREHKAEQCEVASREKQLQVVRLTAGEQIEPAPAVAEAAPPKDDGKRPFLQLAGMSRAPSRSGPLPPLPPAGAGDSLGVVPMNGSSSAPAQPEGEMASFHAGYRAFSNRSYAEALGLFAHFLRENPDHQYADNALFWRGESYLAQGKLLKAVGELERLLRRYPRSEKGPSALFRIGFAYERLNDRQKASEYYFQVGDRYPGSEAARKASRRVAAIREAGGRQTSLIQTAAQR